MPDELYSDSFEQLNFSSISKIVNRQMIVKQGVSVHTGNKIELIKCKTHSEIDCELQILLWNVVFLIWRRCDFRDIR